MSSSPYKQVDTLSVDCPNYQKCLGFLIVLYNGSHTILACSSHKQECRGLVKLASYRGSCKACNTPIDVKSHLIARHVQSSKWVHFKCRETILPAEAEGELAEAEEDANSKQTPPLKCLWCEGSIAPGEGKQCSYGDRIGFRHLKCKRVATNAGTTAAAAAPVIFIDDAHDVQLGNKKARRSSCSSDNDQRSPVFGNTLTDSSENTDHTELENEENPESLVDAAFAARSSPPSTTAATVVSNKSNKKKQSRL